MIRIGIIGDIGSGKSFIARQFGFPVFNADFEVSKIYKKNRFCYNKLKKKFPKYIKSFPINKIDLSNIIINNKKNINKIIKIIHPQVQLNMKRFFIKNKEKKIVILDIPLLIENKINRKKDILIFVQAKKFEINKRLIKRKNFNKKIYKILKGIQLPIEFKKKSVTLL